jgi:hypothetical protein
MKNRANSKCLPRVMAKIDEIIRKYNPYYRSFKQLKQIEKEEEAKSIPNAKEFAEWLLKIGNGKELKHRQFGDDIIKLPDQIITKQKDEFINQLFGNVQNINDLKDICCLSTTNKIAHEMNIEIQDKILPGEVFKKVSIDEIVMQDPTEDPNEYPIEYLNSITPKIPISFFI